MPLVVVDRDPDRPVLGEQIAQQLQTRIDHRQPLTVLQIVVVMLEGALGVVRRIDEDALDPPRAERQQRLERLQIVALNEPVVGVRVAVDGLRFQQSIGHAPRGTLGLGIAEPGQLGHRRSVQS